MAGAWKIGVDGGATKTECILVDPSGAVAGRHTALGCNPSVVGENRAGVLLGEALGALRKGHETDPVASTLLCMAGSRPFWKKFAAGLSGCGRVVTGDDSLPVLELATRGGPGLVLHAGTGSFVAARSADGSAHYAGGLGWRIGDAGSGYDLGRRAVARALLELQGWARPSGMGALVRERTGLSEASLVSRHFNGQPSPTGEIAALASGVLDLAHSGDPAATVAVAESVGALLDLALDVASRVFPDMPAQSLRAGVSGPILNHPGALQLLGSRSDFALSPILEPPIEGVRLLLAREGAATAGNPIN
jgi:glucosamine kinase